VQAFYSQKLEEGLSPRSVILIHAVLHQALENAVKWGLCLVTWQSWYHFLMLGDMMRKSWPLTRRSKY